MESEQKKKKARKTKRKEVEQVNFGGLWFDQQLVMLVVIDWTVV